MIDSSQEDNTIYIHYVGLQWLVYYYCTITYIKGVFLERNGKLSLIFTELGFLIITSKVPTDLSHRPLFKPSELVSYIVRVSTCIITNSQVRDLNKTD